MPANLAFEVADRRKRGYFTIDNVLLDVYGAQLGPHGIAVYAALARFADKDQECWPSHATVAARTGMSRRHVMRMVALLERLGIISVAERTDAKGEHKSNLYTLLDIVGSDSQSPQGSDSQSPRSDHQSPKQSSKKKASTQKKEQRKNYRPPEYADIII